MTIIAYSAALGLTLILQLAAALTAYICRNRVSSTVELDCCQSSSALVRQVEGELVRSLNQSLTEQYGVAGREESTMLLDSLQMTAGCCGANSFQDWRRSDWWDSPGRADNTVPDSCCKSVSSGCGVRDHPSNIYYTGCGPRLARLAGQHLLLLATLALAISLVQSTGIVLAVILVNRLRTVGD